jgi:hypothetical protein
MKQYKLFYEVFYTQMKELYLEIESEQYGFTEENYWREVLKSTNIDEKDFEYLEQKIGMKLPVSFKSFYKLCYAIEDHFDLGGIQLVGNQETKLSFFFKKRKLKGLEQYFFEQATSSRMIEHKMIPFGMYQNRWYICLDMRKDEKDPPIKLYELSDKKLTGLACISNKNWFTSFDKFIRCMISYMQTGDSIGFNAIDREHHFSSAYSYWK